MNNSNCGSSLYPGGKLVMATNNAHKLDEARKICSGRVELLSLADIDCHDEIPETGDTLAANALQKARWVKEHYGYDCIADDTGLMVDALDGAPGVYSARYAGEGHDAKANMAKLLAEMEGVQNRAAHFSTVIALLAGDEEVLLEGRVDGEITTRPEGEEGFGYDPIFRPVGYSETFALMSADEKNRISHRGRALQKLISYLNSRG